MCRICVPPQCTVHTRHDLFRNPAVVAGVAKPCAGASVYSGLVAATGRSAVGTVLVLVSLALFVVGWRLTEQDRFFLLQAATATGRVVGHEAFEREAWKVQKRFRLVVVFPAPNGTRIRFRSVASYGRPPYAVGDSVGVRYDAEDPSRARVDRRIELLAPVLIWMGAVMTLGALGVAVAVLGPRGATGPPTGRTPRLRRP
jgi:hypothetical protein